MSREQHTQPEKRVRLRGEERRALILHSAKRVFARSTYAEASTGELARESEITEPMLYKHFGSKKGLFLAVLSEFGAQFLETLQERISHRAEQDVHDALAHVVDDYRAAIKADPETQRILFQAITESGDPDIARCVGNHNRAVYKFIRQLVERARQDGYLDPTISPDAATWGYMSMILAIQYGLMLNLSGEIARSQDEMSRIWLRGLRAHQD
ncbi:MAG TPA: TetR/AcrR family transcriptional regulator [Ktedonobacteraceae bacterium]